MNVRTATKPAADVTEVAPNNLPAVRDDRPRPSVAAPRMFPPKIAKAIIAVTREVGRIEKDGENKFQNYKYARWEDVVERLSPLLAEHGLIIMQSEQSRSLIEENDKGSTLAIVYEFTLVNDEGDQWPPITWSAYSRLRDGKGVTDDKAGAKCHTQAEKYFCIKQFKIRTADQVDGDAGDEAKPIQTLPKAKSRDIYKKLEEELRTAAAESLPALRAWMVDSVDQVRVMDYDFQDMLRLQLNEALADWKRKQAAPVDDEPEPEAAPPVAEQPAPKPQKGDTVVKSPARQLKEEIAAQQSKEVMPADPKQPAATAPRLVSDKPPDGAQDYGDLPAGVRREFDERKWRIEVDRRIATADTDGLVAIQQELCIPNQKRISPEGWQWHVDAIRARMKALEPPAEPAWDAEAWLKADYAGAVSGAESHEQLEHVKNTILLPAKPKLTTDQWQRAVAAFKARVNAVSAADLLGV